MTLLVGDVAPAHLRPRCWQKRIHPTPEAARHAADLLRARHPEARGATPYWCASHQGWHVGNDRRRSIDMTDIRHALADGGQVVVFLGSGLDMPAEFAAHPQVRTVRANRLANHPNRKSAIASELPSNTKLVIVTNQIDRAVNIQLQEELKRRKLTYVLRTSISAIIATLKEGFEPKNGATPTALLLTDPPIPVPPATVHEPSASPMPVASSSGWKVVPPAPSTTRRQAPKGAVPALIDQHWDAIKDLSNADAGRYLEPHARTAGLPTKATALEQAVRVARLQRKTATSAPPVPEAVADIILILDDAVAGLEMVREWILQQAGQQTEVEDARSKVAAAEAKLAKIAEIEAMLQQLKGE
jgi:hypothetical protein